MGVRFKPSHPTVRLSSLSLEKFLKSGKNLSKAPPKLWSDHGHGPPEEDDQPLPILKLSHPILRTLESCCGSMKEFNQIHTQLIVSGLLQQPLAAGRAVKTLCSFPDSVQHAVSLFEGLEEPDAFICNTIMRTYVNVNDPYTALGFYYEQMVCWEIGSIGDGEKIHARILKFGRVHPTATYRVKNDTWPDSISKGAPKCVKNSGSLSCMSGSNMVAISLGSKHLSLLSNPAKKADLHKPVQLGDQSRSK
ncbi:hypothetical protein AAG906_033549 [Vitis piasezkii]